MTKKIKSILLFFFFLLILLVYLNYSKQKKVINNYEQKKEEIISNNLNTVTDVEYISQDLKGNTYRIVAKKGEVYKESSDILFLTDVIAYIELVESDNIEIRSDFSQYNTVNNNTIFSKNVSVNYLNNVLTGDYLDFSLTNNVMTMSKNVIYKNSKNKLFADNIEMNLKTKDTKISMFENSKKIKIMSNN